MRGLWGVIGLLVLAAPSSASASTICVNVASADCAPPVESNLQTALSRAQSNAGADTVRVGPGDYATTSTSGFTYTSIDPITLTGAGTGRTVIRNGVASPDSVLTVNVLTASGLAASTVSGISVSGADLPNSGTAAFIGANVTASEFSAGSTTNAVAYALRLLPGGAADDVAVVARGPFAVGVGFLGTGSLSDSTVSATRGVEVTPSGTSTGVVRRTRVVATQVGIDVCNASAVLEDMSVQSSALGIDVEGGQRCGATNSQLTARNLTITGAGNAPAGTGVQISAGNSSPRATIVDTVLWNLQTSLRAFASAGYTSTLNVARLAEDSSKRSFGGPGTLAFTDGGGNVGDPLLVDSAAGDLRLRAGSPAIDAGTAGPVAAGESATDRDGAPRVLDGDGDGTARRDIGALEAPAVPVPVPVAAAPQSPVATVPIATPVRDRTAPVLTRLKLRRGKRPQLTLRLSEAAKVTLTLRGLPKGCKRRSKTCRERTLATQRATLRAGSRSLTLGKALRSRLSRATQLRVSAVDAAGNRSRTASLSL